MWRVKEAGSTANKFLTKALVNSNAGNSHVCQVRILRGIVPDLRTLSSIIGCHLICSINWAVINSLGESLTNYFYDIHSLLLRGTTGLIYTHCTTGKNEN